MGQQQLLLVILVTIIVGIATVVAINTFSSAADQANLDAVRNDLAAIASSAQGYFIRPEMLGGGGRSFDDISFNDIAFAAAAIDPADGETAQNENGRYEMSENEGQDFLVTAHPASAPGYVPGTIQEVEGTNTLSGGTDAAAEDQITARVCPDRIIIAPQGESDPDACDS